MHDPPLVVAALAVVLLVVVLALVREARLRRALQRLLAKLLTQWRHPHERTSDAAQHAGRDRGDVDAGRL